jgi:L-ornithine Nalpha-acyltransferase
MIADESHFQLRLATAERDVFAAQRLRYEVFVAELGGDGPLVDHERRLERDAYDPHFDHLVLIDTRRDVAALDAPRWTGLHPRRSTGARPWWRHRR